MPVYLSTYDCIVIFSLQGNIMKIALVIFSIIGFAAMDHGNGTDTSLMPVMKVRRQVSRGEKIVVLESREGPFINCATDPTICSDQQCCIIEEDDKNEGPSLRHISVFNFSCMSFQGEGESCFLDKKPSFLSAMLPYYYRQCPCMPNLTCVPNEETTTVEYDYSYPPDGTCKGDEIN